MYNTTENTDYYLDLTKGGIKGESPSKPDQIKLESWGWNANNPAYVGSAGKIARSGTASVSDLKCRARMSKASPFLFEACVAGTPITSATLTACRAGDDKTKPPKPYFIITLTNVFITGYSTGGSEGNGWPPDDFTLAFAKITVDYKDQEQASVGAKTWDLENKKMG